MDCLPSGIPGDVWAKVDESTMLGTTEPVIGSWGWPGVCRWRIDDNKSKKNEKVGTCKWRWCYGRINEQIINLPAWMVRVEKPDIKKI